MFTKQRTPAVDTAPQAGLTDPTPRHVSHPDYAGCSLQRRVLKAVIYSRQVPRRNCALEGYPQRFFKNEPCLPDANLVPTHSQSTARCRHHPSLPPSAAPRNFSLRVRAPVACQAMACHSSDGMSGDGMSRVALLQSRTAPARHQLANVGGGAPPSAANAPPDWRRGPRSSRHPW